MGARVQLAERRHGLIHCHGVPPRLLLRCTKLCRVLLLEGGKVLTMAATLPVDEMARQLGLYCQLGEIGESLGLSWGGRWHSIKDYPHFELPEWRSLPVVGAAQ